jgi:hypothetical protein
MGLIAGMLRRCRRRVWPLQLPGILPLVHLSMQSRWIGWLQREPPSSLLASALLRIS